MTTKRPPSHTALVRACGAAALLVMLAACGGGGTNNTAGGGAAPPPPPPVATQSITLAGDASQVVAGGKPVTLTATPAVPASIAWTIAEGPGTLSAASGANVTYVPPAAGVSANTPVVIKATAGEASTTYRLTVYPDPGAPGLSLIAGTVGSTGNLDGKGAAARFGNIIDMSADANGNLLVLDAYRTDDFDYIVSTRLRRVGADGEVATLPALPAAAGTALSVSVAPDNIALLLANTADGLAVYRVQADGAAAQWLAPAKTDQSAKRVVAGAGGVAYLIGTRHVVAVAANGDSRVLAGNKDDTTVACRDGVGGDAHLQSIADAVLDKAGNLIVGDCFSVRKISPAGAVTTLAGDLTAGTAVRDGAGPGAHFGAWHNSVAVDQNGELRELDFEQPVTDAAGATSAAYRLRRITSAGATSTLLSGRSAVNFGAVWERLPIPGGATSYQWVRYLSGGQAVVATAGQLYTLDGAKLTSLAGNEGDVTANVVGPAADARFVLPRSLTADPAGTLYLLEEKGKVFAIERSGTVRQLFQDADAPFASQILARDDSLYITHVTRPYQFDKWKFSAAVIYVRRAAGGYTTRTLLAGTNSLLRESDARVDGPGATATFYKADMLGFDGDGNLYVEDVLNGAPLYRKITPAGVVSTVSAPPAGVGAAPDGNRYLFDAAAALVYRVGADGGKTVVAGTAGQDGIRLGALPGTLRGTTALPNTPQMAAITPTGPGSFALISGGAVLKLVLPR
jgi:hypothetical protein